MKILSMSGFIPEHICDTIRFTQYGGDRNISNYCGYASDFISKVMSDDTIDGAVYPKSCDSTRILTSYLSECKKFLFQFGIPPYNAPGAEVHLAYEIKAYKEAVEAHYGVRCDDIRERTELINERNEAVRKTYEELDSLSYSDYIEKLHRMLEKPLAMQEWRGDIRKREKAGKKVYIVGSFLSDTRLAGLIEDASLTVAGDDLPESGRLVYSEPVETDGDIYLNIARSILSMRPSPTQDSFKIITDHDLESIKKMDVRGIIFLTQKYCEPYDYLYSIFSEKADKAGIPALQIKVNGTEDTGKAALALEAFAEMI